MARFLLKNQFFLDAEFPGKPSANHPDRATGFPVMETNGVLCTPELAGLLASAKNRFVSASLDGADAETHEWVVE